MKMNRYGKGKYLLRKAFDGDLLPPEILWREKAAFSDAVGHSMADHLKHMRIVCIRMRNLSKTTGIRPCDAIYKGIAALP